MYFNTNLGSRISNTDITDIEFIKNSDKTDMALNYYLISKTEKTDIE